MLHYTACISSEDEPLRAYNIAHSHWHIYSLTIWTKMASVSSNVAVVLKELLVVLDFQTFLLNMTKHRAWGILSFSRNLVSVRLVWV
jgi:hypothetical protein